MKREPRTRAKGRLMKKARNVPTAFASELEERAYWERGDSTAALDWRRAKRVRDQLGGEAEVPARRRRGSGRSANRKLVFLDLIGRELAPNSPSRSTGVRRITFASRKCIKASKGCIRAK